MALHDVPVEAAVHTHAALEVHLITYSPAAEIGLQHGLVHGGHHILPFLLVHLDHGEAAAVVCHALIDAEFISKINLYCEMIVAVFFLYLDDFSSFFYDSSKHKVLIFRLM